MVTGNHIANSILLLLSSKECKEVLAKLELVRPETSSSLYEAGETIKSGYS